MRTKLEFHIVAGLVLVCLTAVTQRSSACNLPPVAYISGKPLYVGLDAEVGLIGTDSYDPDGYIVVYEWTLPSAAYNISGRYSAVAHCRFNTRGAYTIYLDVFDDLYAWDTDDAQVYVIEADLSWDGSTYLPVNCDDDNGNQVQDMLDSSAGAEDDDLRAIHLDITPDLYGGDAQLSYSGNATIKVWLPDATNRKYSLVTLPRTWAAARVPSTLYVEGIAPNSAPNGSQLTLSYIKNGTTLHSDSVTFTVFDVQLDTSFPASVTAGCTLQLNCTPRGDTTGSFAWSKVSGPGTVTFAPGAGAEDPTFSTAVGGSYTVQVQYTKDGVSVTRKSGTITVNPVSVDITPPGGSVTERYHTLQLDCTPHGGTGSNYAWTKISGPGSVTFSNATIKNPTFLTNTAGNYSIGLQCRINDITVIAPVTTITVVDVDVTAPGSFPVSVARGSTLALDCAGVNGTASGYAWTPADLITPSNIRNPSFTSNTAGTYTATVQCTVGGITVSDARTPIHVVEVASVAENTTGQDPIYVGINTGGAVAYLQAQPYPSAAWPSGQPTWSVVTQPPGAAASVLPASNGAAILTGITTGGLYQAKAVCGSPDDGDTVDITAFQVGITAQISGGVPSALPLTVGAGATVTLNGNPSPDVGGTYVWTVTPLEGRSLLNSTTPNPTLIIDQPGTYTVQVDYTKQYGPSSSSATATGTITASAVSVDISLPQGLHGYMAPYHALQLDCTPSGILGGTYHWSQVSGPITGSFLTDNIQNPTFTVNPPGEYVVKVDYTAGGVTVSSPSNATISVVEVTVDSPANGALTIKAGENLTLNCLPQYGPGSDYSWTVAAPGTVTPATEQATVFSAAEPGYYVASIQCNVGGVPVGSQTGTISVIGVGELYAACGPDFNDTVLYVSPGSTVILGAYPSPEYYDDWPANTPTWSLEGPGGTLVPNHGTYGSSAVLGDLTQPGTYTVTAHCGTSSKSIQIVVVDVDMQLGTAVEKEGFLELGEVRQITLSVQPEDPNGQAGQGVLLATAGGEKVKVWLDQERTSEVNLPAIFPLPQRQTPVTLWVEAVGLSSTWNDVQLQWSFNSPGGIVADEDTLSLTTIDVNVVMATPDVYVDGTQSSKVVQIGLETYSSLDSGVVMLRGISGYDPNFVRFWADEARTQEITLPGAWDLSDPNVLVPQVIYMELIDLPNGPPEITAELAYGRDEDSIVKTSQVTISSLYVDMIPMWEGDPAIEPNLAKPMLLGIWPVPSQGYAMLEAIDGSSYLRVWADEGRTTEVNLPAMWFFPADQLPERLYVEGSASDSNQPVALKLSFHISPESSYSEPGTILPLSEPPSPEVSHVSVDLLSLAPGQTKVCGVWTKQVTCCWLVDATTHQNVVPFQFHPLESDGTCPTGIAGYQRRIDGQWHPLIWWPYLGDVFVSRPCSGISLSFPNGAKEATICPDRPGELEITLSNFTPSLDPKGLPYAALRFSYDGCSWTPGSTAPGALRLWYGGSRERCMSESFEGASDTVGDFLDDQLIFIDWLGLSGVRASTSVSQIVNVEGLVPREEPYDIEVALTPSPKGPISAGSIDVDRDTVWVTVLASCDCSDYMSSTPVEKNGILYTIGEPIRDTRIIRPDESQLVHSGGIITVRAKAGIDQDCKIVNGNKECVTDKLWIVWSDDTGRPASEAFPGGYEGWAITTLQFTTTWRAPMTGPCKISCTWRNVSDDCYYQDPGKTESRTVQVFDFCGWLPLMDPLPGPVYMGEEVVVAVGGWKWSHWEHTDECGNTARYFYKGDRYWFMYNTTTVGQCIWLDARNDFRVRFTDKSRHGIERYAWVMHASQDRYNGTRASGDKEGCEGFYCYICSEYDAVRCTPIYQYWRGKATDPEINAWKDAWPEDDGVGDAYTHPNPIPGPPIDP